MLKQSQSSVLTPLCITLSFEQTNWFSFSSIFEIHLPPLVHHFFQSVVRYSWGTCCYSLLCIFQTFLYFIVSDVLLHMPLSDQLSFKIFLPLGSHFYVIKPDFLICNLCIFYIFIVFSSKHHPSCQGVQISTSLLKAFLVDMPFCLLFYSRLSSQFLHHTIFESFVVTLDCNFSSWSLPFSHFTGIYIAIYSVSSCFHSSSLSPILAPEIIFEILPQILDSILKVLVYYYHFFFSDTVYPLLTPVIKLPISNRGELYCTYQYSLWIFSTFCPLIGCQRLTVSCDVQDIFTTRVDKCCSWIFTRLAVLQHSPYQMLLTKLTEMLIF